jgi:hypothetical protein
MPHPFKTTLNPPGKPPTMQQDIRKSLDEGAMGRFQWLAVAICVMLVMLDGFDVLVMAFTASSI